MAEQLILTQEGYDKLVAEHDELVSVKRAEISARLKEAISYGDLSENAEYDAAKDEQAEVEERIQKLEEMLRTAIIAATEENTGDVVNVGSEVKIKNVATKDELNIVIVGATESDPINNKISNSSPIGQAIMGHKKGDTIHVTVGEVIIDYKIMSISK